MKYLASVLVLSTIIIIGCSSNSTENELVNNDEIIKEEDSIIENDNNNIDNVNVKEDETKEQGNQDDKSEKKQNNDEQAITDEIEEKKDSLLTSDEAINKIKEYLNINYDDEVNIVVDREEDGKFIIQVFDVIAGDDGVGHTATRGWYSVDRTTGKVALLF